MYPGQLSCTEERLIFSIRGSEFSWPWQIMDAVEIDGTLLKIREDGVEVLSFQAAGSRSDFLRVAIQARNFYQRTF
jgi:hypothetical protein